MFHELLIIRAAGRMKKKIVQYASIDKSHWEEIDTSAVDRFEWRKSDFSEDQRKLTQI